MDCNYICNKIQQAIINYQKSNPDLSDAMIVIDIKKPVSNDTNMIPKITYKNSPT
jgi:GTP-binding protein EngB required for normal cell division